ncbi:MAG TPA: cell division topological specificity factor MinE [Acetobacteraceae bacterium]|jgi:cell division topological specificity factor
MNLFSLFSRSNNSAPIARDRLQILLAHERAFSGHPDLVATLQKEILAVIVKHVAVDREKVQVKLDRGAAVSTLEIDIEMPASALVADKPAKAAPGP